MTDHNSRGRCFSTFLLVGVKVSAYAHKKKKQKTTEGGGESSLKREQPSAPLKQKHN